MVFADAIFYLKANALESNDFEISLFIALHFRISFLYIVQRINVENPFPTDNRLRWVAASPVSILEKFAFHSTALAAEDFVLP